MMRNFFIAIAIVAVVGAGTALATPAFAQMTELTGQVNQKIDDLQTLLFRIAELSKQLAALQEQLRINKATAVTPAAPVRADVAKHRICKVLARNLSAGTSGDDVASLQEFLREQGHLSATATGFFGPLTRAAVARWQASEGVSAVGIFGPISRERLHRWCERPGAASRFDASPQRGSAPLTVKFTSNKFATHDAGEPQHLVDFGDGSELERIGCLNFVGPDLGSGRCEEWGVEHTYVKEGTYTAVLWRHEPIFVAGMFVSNPGRTAIARLQIFVGDASQCTKEYRAVCGSKQVQCITTPCNPIQQTYDNRCMMEADGAAFVHEGACRGQGYDPENDRRCRAWYDGCNSCSRDTPDGPAMCTLRACTQESMTRPYCTAYFDNAGSPPVACTADARQCPDGSWVGRTGPNCQFVCP